jgi:DNA-binding transcriptional ArsR family regulator
MLRLLSKQALTQKQLSDILGISPPSVDHHLKGLTRGQMISVVRKEVGSHGIMQKWYMSNAEAFVVDREHLPNDIRRYFMPMDIERTRGVTAALSLLKGTVIPSTAQMETLTRRMCTAICRVAQNYKGRLEDDPEKTTHALYVEALKQLQI